MSYTSPHAWVQAHGVGAGGHPYTVQAAQQAFEAGGNAIDAAVAAQLMAMVAEPLLTGLGGAGMATIHHQGQTKVLDFFSTMPGMNRSGPFAPLNHLNVNFGPDVQHFSYGVASIAPPGMIHGLWTLHQTAGSLPLPQLARWAADQAEKGLAVSHGLQKSIGLLAPIVQLDDYLAPKFLDADGKAVQAGHFYDLAEMSETLMRWAEGGPSALLSGEPLQDLLNVVGPFAPLGLDDLQCNPVRWHTARQQRYGIGSHADSLIWTPGLPSQGGLQILSILKELQRLEAQCFPHDLTDASQMTIDPLGKDMVNWLACAMRDAEYYKGDDWPQALLESSHPHHGYWHDHSAGFTTHISTADANGSLVGITSSLGETAGVSVANRGLILNNFLGEHDVAPPHCNLVAGRKLFTMCAPTLIQHSGDGSFYMLGSGGSSRIRSVILHGIVYLLDHRCNTQLDLAQVAHAARSHWENGKLRIETKGRHDQCMQQLADTWQDALITFQGDNLYFGGLHMSAVSSHGLLGAGDARRSGSHVIV